MLQNFLIILFAVGLLVAVYFLKSFLDNKFSKTLPFTKKEYFLNPAERKFFEELQSYLPSHLVVFPQVVLSSIIKCNSSSQFWKYHNKINRKIVDFVVFEKQYLKPVLVIEYDGSTHDRSDRIIRDDFVKDALTVTGINLVRIRHNKDKNASEIILEALNNN